MKTIISAALALAVAGVFGLGTLFTAAPASAQAQTQQMEKAPAKKAEKKAMKHSARNASKNAGSKGVMALQEALNKHGASLKADGRMGKATRAALKEYQAKNNLKATGRLDKTTRTKLGL